MFLEIYRCKMCGKKFEGEYVDKVVADIELLNKVDVNRHFCKNGNMGVTELVGFKKIDN